MGKKTVTVLVRTRDCNGDEIFLQRKKRMKKYLYLFKGWVDWKLMNDPVYAIDEELNGMVKKIERLLTDRKEKMEVILLMKKELLQSTRETRGLSTPYRIKVEPKEVPFAYHKNRQPVRQLWRAIFDRKFLRKFGGGDTQKVSSGNTTIDNDGNMTTVTAYVPESHKGYAKHLGSSGDYDEVQIAKKPPQQNKKKNNNGQHQNNQQHNN